jgi:unsaturated chondroitin disaccharide hydrolase
MVRNFIFGCLFFLLFLYMHTVQAALDPDINSDSIVNWRDGRYLASFWNAFGCNVFNNWCQGADLNTSGDVGLPDLMIISENWLSGDVPYLLVRIPEVFDFADSQLTTTAQTLSSSQYPKHTISYSSWYTTAASMWTSGFFPGCLWSLYEMTGETDYLAWAVQWTEGLASQAATSNMDLGFMIMLSYEYGYRLTGNPEYPPVILQAAESLAGRYDPDVGCIRSWDWGTWQYPVIIDSMMSLNLLFWAADHGGPANLRDIAIHHARQIRKEHIRPDGGTYHVVDYNPQTGEVINKMTWQGYSTESTWARGQAWGIYGFTVVYRETRDPNMLATAILLADYYIDHLPQDAVPYWDFNAPDIPNAARDSSAGAIAASALLELSTFIGDVSKQRLYIQTAEDSLVSLSASISQGGYLAMDASGQASSPSILMHACDNYPAGRIDMGLIYADYYFIESLMKYDAIVLSQFKYNLNRVPKGITVQIE